MFQYVIRYGMWYCWKVAGETKPVPSQAKNSNPCEPSFLRLRCVRSSSLSLCWGDFKKPSIYSASFRITCGDYYIGMLIKGGMGVAASVARTNYTSFNVSLSLGGGYYNTRRWRFILMNSSPKPSNDAGLAVQKCRNMRVNRYRARSYLIHHSPGAKILLVQTEVVNKIM